MDIYQNLNIRSNQLFWKFCYNQLKERSSKITLIFLLKVQEVKIHFEKLKWAKSCLSNKLFLAFHFRLHKKLFKTSKVQFSLVECYNSQKSPSIFQKKPLASYLYLHDSVTSTEDGNFRRIKNEVFLIPGSQTYDLQWC